jgi:large subunit ribosomal protein L4
MKLKVQNSAGSETGKQVELSDAVFGIEPNDHAIYLDVKQHLANRRQGTHKAKERGEVEGSRKKIKRQKGTGTARAGDIKNPLFRGGGRVFGPKPRDYSFKLNKKVKRLARRSALSYKAGAQSIVVLEDFQMDSPKTKQYVEMLKNLGVDQSKTLLVLPESDRNILLSGRNVEKTKITRADRINTYDVMNANTVILSEKSVAIINENLQA